MVGNLDFVCIAGTVSLMSLILWDIIGTTQAMNEADLYTIFEQHGSVQLYETRSVVYDLHVKVDYVCFSGKCYPLPVLIFPPNVVPLCGSKSTRGICEFLKTVPLKIWPHCRGFKGSREYLSLFKSDLAHFNQR